MMTNVNVSDAMSFAVSCHVMFYYINTKHTFLMKLILGGHYTETSTISCQ